MKPGRAPGLVLVLPADRSGPIGVAFYFDDPQGRLSWRPADPETQRRLWAAVEVFFDEADEGEAA